MSVKNQDDRNRFRSKTVGFRVSPEEWNQFEIAVKISGLNKQDYLINRLHDRSIIVQGSPRVYKALKLEFEKILNQLERIENGEKVDEELLETINLISRTMNGFALDELS